MHKGMQSNRIKIREPSRSEKDRNFLVYDIEPVMSITHERDKSDIFEYERDNPLGGFQVSKTNWMRKAT